MGAPLLIGTNHLYRTKAFKAIGGYQDSIIEDHLTSMVIYANTNEQGNYWRGVYTPDILAVGEGPTSFTDYFNQQKRWAYGIWEIATKSSPKTLKQMGRAQALSFIMLQFFYPSVAIAWIASFISTLLFTIYSTELSSIGGLLVVIWAFSISTTLWLFLWLRKFNLVEHERKDWGVQGMGLLLMCIPVYVSAAWEALTRKPLTYAVTAKGDLTSPDTLNTFYPHLFWIGFNLIIIGLASSIGGPLIGPTAGWSLFRILICLLPIALYIYAIGRTGVFSKWYVRNLIYLGFRKQARQHKAFSQVANLTQVKE
jgi:cellulose synthase/poly-beta-1,6-N-acetylglucosamine synthase-like glycosyltransferase